MVPAASDHSHVHYVAAEGVEGVPLYCSASIHGTGAAAALSREESGPESSHMAFLHGNMTSI